MAEPGEKNHADEIRDVARKRVAQNPDSKVSKALAWLLDECIRIPGTEIRFGLDPIIGLIPGAGDAIANLIGLVVLGDAGRKGLPVKTLVRMGGNMAINALVGLIPGLGDLFSAWFKSNSRNYKMLKEFTESEDGQQAKGGWWPIFVLFFLVVAVIAINVAVFILLFQFLGWLPELFSRD